MVDDDLTESGPGRWLWILLFASLAALIVIWLVNSWVVESEVQQGASPSGLTFPAKPGYEVTGNRPAEGGAGGEEAR